MHSLSMPDVGQMFYEALLSISIRQLANTSNTVRDIRLSHRTPLINPRGPGEIGRQSRGKPNNNCLGQMLRSDLLKLSALSVFVDSRAIPQDMLRTTNNLVAMFAMAITHLDFSQALIIPKCSRGNMSENMFLFTAKPVNNSLQGVVVKFIDIPTKSTHAVDGLSPTSSHNAINGTLQVLPRHVQHMDGLLAWASDNEVNTKFTVIELEVTNKQPNMPKTVRLMVILNTIV
jgi:hypothetical protein